MNGYGRHFIEKQDCHDNLSNKHLLVGQCWWFQTREVSHTSHLYGAPNEKHRWCDLPASQEKKHHDSMVLPPNKITKTPNGMYINVHTYILIYIHPLFYSLWKKNESQLSFKNPIRLGIHPSIYPSASCCRKALAICCAEHPGLVVPKGGVNQRPSRRDQKGRPFLREVQGWIPPTIFGGEDFPIFPSCSHKSWGFLRGKMGVYLQY